MTAVIVVLVIVAIAVVGWFAYQAKKKRREALQTFATQYGLEYSRADTVGFAGFGFELFRQGDGRGWENVLSGEWQGMPVREADYWYYTESTDSEGHETKSYHHFSVVVAELGAAMPHVTVARENVFTRMADHMGLRDIDFELEEFNRAFNVKSPDREFAFKLIDARMIGWLMTAGREFAFEVLGPNLLVYSKRRKPLDLIPLFGTAKEFRDHVPRLVWNEYGTGNVEGNQTRGAEA